MTALDRSTRGLFRWPRLAVSADGAALCLPADLSRWISLAEVFAASVLYHVISWLIFFADRARALARSGRPREARGLLALFWSVLHVFQAFAVRALGDRAAAGAS